MPNPQQHEESLNSSEQLSSTFNSVASPKVEFAPRSNPGVFAAFEKASLKTQQLVIATTSAVISALAVLAVIKISAYTIPPPGSTTLSKLTTMGLAALITGVIVGVATWALAQITINQINRTIDNLQAQFKAVAQGNLGAQATVYSSKELGQLVRSFNQMTQALNTTLNEAQRKAEAQEKEDLPQKLIQIDSTLELTSSSNLIVDADVILSEDDEQAVIPPGTLLDFLDNLQNWFRVSSTSEILVGSSSLEEIQKRKEELQYRQVWLQALKDETARELQVLYLIDETLEQDNEG
ncbi:MAG TPA: HAMP domain-containing protein [Coleofasciculaceae cyanobacterium]|jgi:HAMP domain-containing protein